MEQIRGLMIAIEGLICRRHPSVLARLRSRFDGAGGRGGADEIGWAELSWHGGRRLSELSSRLDTLGRSRNPNCASAVFSGDEDLLLAHQLPAIGQHVACKYNYAIGNWVWTVPGKRQMNSLARPNRLDLRLHFGS